MRKVTIPAVLAPVLLLTALAVAQTVPRAPVVRIGKAQPTPTPTPLPDPTGVYAGQAAVQVEGQAGTFNERWQIAIKAQPCAECGPGQYYVYGTNYAGSQYTSGATERGGVYGFITPSGKSVGLELFAINCPFVNPSNYRPPVPGSNGYVGNELGGSFGESPGTPVTIVNGVLAGRFSGRDCFGQLITADVTLQRQAGLPVSLGCVSLAGNYTGTFANSCGGSGSGSITVNQTGCDFSALLGALKSGLEGTITSATTATISVNDPCATAIYGGSLNIVSSSTITGTYSGTSNGGFGCCPAGPFSGSFTATRS
jgi:hypothetical protein